MRINKGVFFTLSLLAVFIFGISIKAQEIEVNAGSDFVSRYIWRGLNVNESINVQPSLSLSVSGFELGIWGSYAFTGSNSTDDYYSFSHEIDFLIGYSHTIDDVVTVSALLTDYYFPNAGIRMGNFNNYNDKDGPGAHTLEAGLSVAGPGSCPVTLSGYINFYNDAGNNTYFQLDYSTELNNVNINFFLGASAGSKKNPVYYGTDKLNVINTGIQATKDIRITDEFSLPISVTYILNPRIEISYLVVGISI